MAGYNYSQQGNDYNYYQYDYSQWQQYQDNNPHYQYDQNDYANYPYKDDIGVDSIDLGIIQETDLDTTRQPPTPTPAKAATAVSYTHLTLPTRPLV